MAAFFLDFGLLVSAAASPARSNNAVVGSGSLTEDHLESDPPSAAEIRALRDHISDCFDGDGASGVHGIGHARDERAGEAALRIERERRVLARHADSDRD